MPGITFVPNMKPMNLESLKIKVCTLEAYIVVNTTLESWNCNLLVHYTFRLYLLLDQSGEIRAIF